MLQGVKLSKTQNPTMTEDRKRMKVIPYALAIGSIKYAMLCTRSIVYPTLFLAREYNSDLGVDHWTAVKIILRGLRKYNHNHFIIASGAYFQQSPTCTRVNNLVHIAM